MFRGGHPLLSIGLAVAFFSAGPDPVASELLKSAWEQNGFARTRFEIGGMEGRNNPVRRELKRPFDGEEIFVRYRIRYDASTIDRPPGDEGEFFVLWLDETEGSDQSTHSGGVPNVGIHVSGEENRFMVRFSSGGEKFGRPLEGDRDFLIVARLWKSRPGADAPFDQLDLWVDPESGAEFRPDASASNPRAIGKISWIGFSTGAKTEWEDRIFVWDIDLAPTWRGILDLPEEAGEEPGDGPEPAARPEPTIDFASQVVPILETRCFSCHEGEEAKKDIRLDIYDEVLNLTTPGKAAESHLISMIEKGEMPPENREPLTKGELATLRTWIDEGVIWDEAILPTPVPETEHWSFQPVTRPEIPEVKNREWVRTPVDAFIARRHESLGLTPAPEAAPEILRRRLSLDLLGLPPTEGMESVEALLSDPGYGERWGRHWLDVARWAESNGHQHNRDRPHAWRYRDWVVDAFNDDLPFDRFVEAQIAGDESVSGDDGDLAATGFLAAARYSGNELDKEIQRNDILVDIVNTTGSAFLGLTFECAQCHTHKFDPLTIRDYYRMKAFFENGQPGNLTYATVDRERARELVSERWAIFDRTYQRQVLIRKKKGIPDPALVIPKSVVKAMTAADRKRYDELDREIAGLEQVWGFFSPERSLGGRAVTPHEMRWPLGRDYEKLRQRKTYLLLRGDVRARGPEVEPGWPVVFGKTEVEGSPSRTALAGWLTSPGNPLTSRVWVNRIWQWHFGRGLVETSGDFGKQGANPSHPELLDFLAGELIDSGWSTKHVHRLILESATYRQSSRFSEANAEIDPDNLALWRWVPRRLEAEAIRDSMLAAAGLLDPRRGGPSDAIGQPSRRRSLYLKQRRDRFPDQQMLFDSANGVVSCSRRRVSTNSLQPLWLLNSGFSREMAESLARNSGSVEVAFFTALGRRPDDREIATLRRLENRHGLASACLALLNSSEFIYIP